MDNILGPLLAFLVIALPLWLVYVLLELDVRLDGWFRWKQPAARNHLPKEKDKVGDT
ncbi:MAG: hypothetical protein LLG15_10020 [Betaproteobacteria bacterium]|nr:hypothetical protein [Betaproteobacteria bacterium]